MHVRPLAVLEGLEQVGPHLLEVVEEGLLAVRVGPTKGDHVQEVVLLDPHRGELGEQVWEGLDVAPVDADVDVDDHPAVVEGVLKPLDLFVEGALGAHQGVVDPGVGAVDGEGDLAEAGVDGALEEVTVCKQAAVGDGLDPLVAGEAAELHKLDEVGVDRGFATREDQPLRTLAPTVEDLSLDLFT